MKKLTYILLIFTLLGHSQFDYEKYIWSLGVDPKLAIAGAYDYDKTPVLDVSLYAVTQINKNEFGLFAEYADLKPYYFSTGFVYNRVVNIFNSEKTETLVGVNLLYLQRGFGCSYKKDFLTFDIHAETRFYLLERCAIAFSISDTYRPDLVYRYNGKNHVVSGTIKFNYSITR